MPGQPDDELASPSRTLAARLHRPAVELHQAANDGEADAEAALGPIRWLIALHEELEHRSKPVGANPATVVAYPDGDLVVLTPGIDLDVTARVGVFRRVLQQVGDHLRETNDIAIDVERADRHRNRDLMFPGVDERPGDFDRARDCRGHVEALAPQVDLAHRRPRDVEQIVHQTREVRHLPLDHRAFTLGRGIVGAHPH